MTATQRPTRASVQSAALAAPRPAPRRPPRPTPLRVVAPGERTPLARLRRRRLIVFGLAALAVIGLFGLVAEHTVLAQQQFRLASLQSQAAAESARNQALQLQVAQLQSPSRIVSEARTKLGMVPPAGITYLVPGQKGAKVKGQVTPTPTISQTPPASSSATTIPALSSTSAAAPTSPSSSSAP
ncbi:MAG TPA: septum formation initiator family protein [Acidimicrobiales bacterium]|nr:septum formation initiator family protein [Acidimicrobiales bacterium]